MEYSAFREMFESEIKQFWKNRFGSSSLPEQVMREIYRETVKRSAFDRTGVRLLMAEVIVGMAIGDSAKLPTPVRVLYPSAQPGGKWLPESEIMERLASTLRKQPLLPRSIAMMRLHGLDYAPIDELLNGCIDSIVDRIPAAHAKGMTASGQLLQEFRQTLAEKIEGKLNQLWLVDLASHQDDTLSEDETWTTLVHISGLPRERRFASRSDSTNRLRTIWLRCKGNLLAQFPHYGVFQISEKNHVDQKR